VVGKEKDKRDMEDGEGNMEFRIKSWERLRLRFKEIYQ
jgi:hypothetical protein